MFIAIKKVLLVDALLNSIICMYVCMYRSKYQNIVVFTVNGKVQLSRDGPDIACRQGLRIVSSCNRSPLTLTAQLSLGFDL